MLRLVLIQSIDAGNRMNDIKRLLFYNKDLPASSVNWWIQLLAKQVVIPEAEDRYAKRLESHVIQRLLHVGAGLQTEASEFNEALLNHIESGEPLDHVNLAEELSDVMWYLGIGCKILGTTMTQVMRKNIAKLFVRFRGKFSESRVTDRDLKAERTELER